MWILTNKQNRVIFIDSSLPSYLNSIIGSILQKNWIKDNKINELNCINYEYQNLSLVEARINDNDLKSAQLLNKKCSLLKLISVKVEEVRFPYKKQLYAQNSVYEFKFNQALQFINSNFNKNLLNELPFLQDEIYIQNTSAEITSLSIQKAYHECVNILRCSERSRRLFNERVLLCNDMQILLSLEHQINTLNNFQLVIN